MASDKADRRIHNSVQITHRNPLWTGGLKIASASIINIREFIHLAIMWHKHHHHHHRPVMGKSKRTNTFVSSQPLSRDERDDAEKIMVIPIPWYTMVLSWYFWMACRQFWLLSNWTIYYWVSVFVMSTMSHALVEFAHHTLAVLAMTKIHSVTQRPMSEMNALSIGR